MRKLTFLFAFIVSTIFAMTQVHTGHRSEQLQEKGHELSVESFQLKSLESSNKGEEFTLTIVIVGNGIVWVNGVEYDICEDPIIFDVNEEVTILAEAEEGWEFTEWSGDLIGSELEETFIMDNDKVITATFHEITEDLLAIAQVTSDFNGQHISCYEASDGEVEVTAIGGTAPYTYQWCANAGSATTAQVTGLSAETYSVTVTDVNGCYVIEEVTLIEPEELIVTIYSLSETTLYVVVEGGVPPYEYQWCENTNYATTPLVEELPPGDYSVTVTDINACVDSSEELAGSAYMATGTVFFDYNSNCEIDPEDLLIPQSIISIQPGNFYTLTNENGKYSIILFEPGTYTLSPVVPPLFELICPIGGVHEITFIESEQEIFDGLDFAYDATYDCPLLHVNIASGDLRPCMLGTFAVNYSNQGIIASEGTYIEIEFDEYIIPISSTLPWSSVEGNVYTFDIGELSAFESGSFNICVNIHCDLSLVGHTQCATAEIFAENTCEFVNPGVPEVPAVAWGGPPEYNTEWDNSSISVTGECVEDFEACFIIENTGEFGEGDMETPNEYRIFANDTLVYIGEFQLDGGESIEICWETEGRAIRLEADQSDGHPGFSNPQVTIEDCGDYLGSSLGYIITTPFNDYNYDIDIHCQELTAAYDPNDKHVQPSGITENNYIDNDAVLNYLINFQNTGNDTAFLVIIKDTLSPYLDVSTIQNGASSHPHTFEVSGQGVLTWTFPNIMLPDSATNEPESKGFVSFSIHQKPLIAPDEYGTVISNKAEIYFDFNEPIVTNQVDLIFWELPLIITHKPDLVSSEYEINVYPNPANSQATVKIKNYKDNYPLEFILYDINGKVLRNINNINSDEFSVNFDLLPAGIYIYRISSGNKRLGEGKLILE